MALLFKNYKRGAKFKPAQYDPSGTGVIRRQFMKQLNSKLTELKRRIWMQLLIEQQYGLTENAEDDYNHPSYVDQFREWLMKQIKDLFYEEDENSWWTQYIAKGWQIGVQKVQKFFDPKAQNPLLMPVGIDRVKVLAKRALTELQNYGTTLAQKLTRDLLDGLTQGLSPREVARNMVTSADLSAPQALTIARTETVRAHAEGQIATLERLGVEEVGVAVEFTTSGLGMTAKKNPSPCRICSCYQGVVLKLEEAKGLIPVHPNCLCSLVPANVGENGTGQIRSYKGITHAMKKAIRAGASKKTTKRQLAEREKRATERISRKRPKSIV